jgi:hypothetical protein
MDIDNIPEEHTRTFNKPRLSAYNPSNTANREPLYSVEDFAAIVGASEDFIRKKLKEVPLAVFKTSKLTVLYRRVDIITWWQQFKDFRSNAFKGSASGIRGLYVSDTIVRCSILNKKKKYSATFTIAKYGKNAALDLGKTWLQDKRKELGVV